jgi:hypothetical protein
LVAIAAITLLAHTDSDTSGTPHKRAIGTVSAD